MIFLHTYHPEPVALSIGSLDIHWYGLIIAGAVLLGFLLCLRLAGKKNIAADHFYNLFFCFVVAGLIGGRLGHIIGEWDYYRLYPAEIIKVWHGGLAIQGVILGCALSVFIYSRLKRVSGWLLTDTIVVVMPLMQAIGRWGNYFNQEIYGKPTGLSWGIPIDPANRLAGYGMYQYFQPVFLYESLLMLLVFCFMYLLWKKAKLQTGQLTLVYFIVFPVVRFSLDFVKIGMLKAGPLLLTQWISLAFIAAAILIWRQLARAKEIIV